MSSKEKDSLGERMKFYERRHHLTFLKTLPVICRIDGRSFHTFTKDLPRPYDERLSKLMIGTTKFLVEETHARCGYTQSDEITLVWYAQDFESEIFFGAKMAKLTSVVCSLATAYFNRMLPESLPEKMYELAIFDNRAFEVPSTTEAVNVFMWREQDAIRNSIQMAARSFFSHKECLNKDCKTLVCMLGEKGIKWGDYPRFFKRGTYVRRKTIERKFTPEELVRLPVKHKAQQDPDMTVVRSTVMEEDFPALTEIVNRAEVIFLGAEPLVKELNVVR
jgi:tRNA(His) guanylyltransferase